MSDDHTGVVEVTHPGRRHPFTGSSGLEDAQFGIAKASLHKWMTTAMEVIPPWGKGHLCTSLSGAQGSI